MNSTEEIYYRRYLNDVGAITVPHSLGGLTTYSDPLNVSPLSADWTPAAMPYTFDGNNRYGILVNASGLQFINTGGGNASVMQYVACNKLTAVNKLSQYVQATLVSNVNGSGQIVSGPAIFIGPDLAGTYLFTFYNAVPDFVGGNYVIKKFLMNYNTNSVTTLVSTTGVTPTINDIVKLTGIINPSSTDLQLYINGVLKATYSDSSATRLKQGLPGMASYFCSTNASQGWKNFVGGVYP